MLSVVRVVSWNTHNGPNDASDDADFRTILEAIGSDSERATIVAVQETDLHAGGSIGRLENILDDLYPMTDYASAVSTPDSGGDATGFLYDTAMVGLVSLAEVPGDLTHSILRGQFRPQGSAGHEDVYVYSVHLSSSAGPTTRAIEALTIRQDSDALGDGANVLIVGDFNMQGSSEPAWANLTAIGAGQAHDVVGPDGTGECHDSAEFLAIHSQDPGGAMDDRFDLQFASGELFDGRGIDYVVGSYHVFGNNGTHAPNQPITTGSGASLVVLEALVRASDHLPIVADYEVIAPPGDIDKDNDVDSADFIILITNYTGPFDPGSGDKPRIDGDLDFDGDVDSADLQIIVASWTGFQSSRRSAPAEIQLDNLSGWTESDPPSGHFDELAIDKVFTRLALPGNLC